MIYFNVFELVVLGLSTYEPISAQVCFQLVVHFGARVLLTSQW